MAFTTPEPATAESAITLTLPRTSKASVGTVVPTPTSPFELTIKLSSSTWTPLRKLKAFLILAIYTNFLVIYYDKASTLELSSLIASIRIGMILWYWTDKYPFSLTLVSSGRPSASSSCAITPVLAEPSAIIS